MVLLGVTLALLGFGLVMVWSASSALAQERHDSPYYFLVKQIAWGSIGLVGMVLALRLDYKTLRRPAFIYPLLIVSTLLLIVVLFLPAVNGTHRWIRLGALSFQPAELAKIAIVVFLAYHIERRADRINELVTLFPALLLLSWFGFLVLIQQDLGSAFCLVLTGCVCCSPPACGSYFAALAKRALSGSRQVMAALWRRMRITSSSTVGRSAGGRLPRDQSLIAVGTGGHGRRPMKMPEAALPAVPTATSCSRRSARARAAPAVAVAIVLVVLPGAAFGRRGARPTSSAAPRRGPDAVDQRRSSTSPWCSGRCLPMGSGPFISAGGSPRVRVFGSARPTCRSTGLTWRARS
jgi:cell division protein FtsW